MQRFDSFILLGVDSIRRMWIIVLEGESHPPRNGVAHPHLKKLLVLAFEDVNPNQEQEEHKNKEPYGGEH